MTTSNIYVEGGQGNDNFVFGNNLSTADSVVGGLGFDTLAATSAALVGYSKPTPATISGIESLYVATNLGGDLTLSNIQAGITEVELGGTADGRTITFDAGTAAVVALDGTLTAGQNLTVAVAGTGIADSVTFYNDNETSGTDAYNGANLIAAGVETVTINSSTLAGSATQDIGSVSVTATAGFAGSETLNISGNNAVTVQAITADVINASGQTPTVGTVFDMQAAAAGAASITGSGGNDVLRGAAAAAASIEGGAGADSIFGGSANDHLHGGEGNDTVTAGAGNDHVEGNAGNDRAIFADGTLTMADSVDGGTGTNTLVGSTGDLGSLSGLARTTFNNIQTLEVSNAQANAINASNIDSSINKVVLANGYTSGTLTLNAGASTVQFNADTGAPTVTLSVGGSATTDAITVTNGTTAALGYGGHAFTATGAESLTINTSSTDATAQDITIGAVTVTGSTGATTAETVVFTGANRITSGVITADIVDASGLTATSGTLFTMSAGANTAASITGSGGNDVLLGQTATATTIVAGAGNDTITGGTKADSISGDAGIDSITGGGGNDILLGGAGNDTINETLGATDIVSIDGGAGNDAVTITNTANLVVADVVKGGEGIDTLNLDSAVVAGSGVSEFETVSFSTAVNQSMANFTNNGGFTQINVATGANAITNAGAAVATLRAADAVTTLSLARATDTSTDALTVGALADETTTLTSLTVNNEESLTFAQGGITTTTNDLIIGSLDAIDATTVTVTGAQDTSVVVNASAAATGFGTTARAITVDASASTGTVTFDASSALSTQGLTMTASTGAGNAVFTSGAGADALTGSTQADTLVSGAGADTINSGSGADSILSGGGADIISSGSGADTVDGGANVDAITLSVDATADRIIQNIENSAVATNTVFAGLTVAAGDTLTFGNGVDVINNFKAGAGGDVLQVVNGETVTSNSLIGATTANLAGTSKTFYVSGSYNAATGVFTVAANGTGADTAIVQTLGSGTSNNLTTNQSAVVLVGVDTDDLANGNFVTNTTMNVTVAQAAALPVGTPYNLVDTNSALAAASAAILNGAINITGSGAATTAACAQTVFNATNSGNTLLSAVSDTAALVAGLTFGANDTITTLTANTAATVAQATTIAGFKTAADATNVVYNVSDVTANIVAGAALNDAVNITVSDLTNVATINIVEAASNTGVNSYNSLTDTAANLVTLNNAVVSLVTGAVTASTAATVAQATTLAGFTHAVSYSVSDLAANIVAGAGLNDAVNITVTDTADAAQATTVGNATNTGTISIANTTDYFTSIQAMDTTAGGQRALTNTAGEVTAQGNNAANNIDMGAFTINNLTIQGLGGNDTIVAGSGTDIISGGTGADNLSGGAARDNFAQVNTDSVVYSSDAGWTWAALGVGDTLVFGGGVDVYADFAAGALGDIFNTGAVGVTYLANGANLTAQAIDTNYAIRGTWNAFTATFTQAAAGNDVLIVADSANADLSNAANDQAFAIVVGVAGNLVNGNFL